MELSATVTFDHPTIAALANHIAGAASTLDCPCIQCHLMHMAGKERYIVNDTDSDRFDAGELSAGQLSAAMPGSAGEEQEEDERPVQRRQRRTKKAIKVDTAAVEATDNEVLIGLLLSHQFYDEQWNCIMHLS